MSNVKTCPKCGQYVQPDELFCPYCGQRMDKPLNASMGFRCKVCGAHNVAGMAFCTACGTPANQSGRAQAEVSPGVHGAAGAASVRTCPGCGHKNTGEIMFCDNCGMLLPESVTETPSHPAVEKAVQPKTEARTQNGYPAKPAMPQKPAASSPKEPAKASIDDWFAPAPQSAPAAGAAKPVPMQTSTDPFAVGGTTAADDWGSVVPAKKAGLSNLRKGLIIGGAALAVIILVATLCGAQTVGAVIAGAALYVIILVMVLIAVLSCGLKNRLIIGGGVLASIVIFLIMGLIGMLGGGLDAGVVIIGGAALSVTILVMAMIVVLSDSIKRGLIIGGSALAAIILILILIVVLGGGSDSKETFVPEPTITATVEPTESPTPTPTPTPTPSPTPSPTPCPHISDKYTVKSEDREPIDHDNSDHKLIIIKDRTCRVCEEALPTTADSMIETKEPHSYSGNTCTACGYVKPEPQEISVDGVESMHDLEVIWYTDENHRAHKTVANVSAITDGNSNTRFIWTLWDKEYMYGDTQFKFEFDGDEISMIMIRNGNVESEEKYKEYARLITLNLRIYYRGGGYATEIVELGDNFNEEYQVHIMEKTHKNVDRIEIWHDDQGRVQGYGNTQNYCVITDIKFMGYPAQDQK